MTINESVLKKGTLTLGVTPLDMSCQITNCRITSAYSDDGNSVTTLCGDTKPAPRTLDGRKLEGTFVQDFDLDELSGGVIDYLYNHDLEVVPFEFVPDDLATAPTITGNVLLEVPAETYGGDVNKRITSDFAWNMQEEPLRTYPTGGAQMAGASASRVSSE
jgi:hypothetical protein